MILGNLLKYMGHFKQAPMTLCLLRDVYLDGMGSEKAFVLFFILYCSVFIFMCIYLKSFAEFHHYPIVKFSQWYSPDGLCNL